MTDRGYHHIISLTNNPRLAALYHRMGFQPTSDPAYAERQAKSPGVQIYVHHVGK
jgi:hypothetical protein